MAIQLVLREEVRNALGDNAIDHLECLYQRGTTLAADILEASTMEFWVRPINAENAASCVREHRMRKGSWMIFRDQHSRQVLAVDEVTNYGREHGLEAVIYGPLQSHLSAWWLFHAWRATDFLLDTIEGIADWRLTTAPTLARGLIEQLACLTYESLKVSKAWNECKIKGGTSEEDHLALVDERLAPLMFKLQNSSRIDGMPQELKAENVLAYVRTLAKATQDKRYLQWYDWLSDSSHPALGAKIALASQIREHESGAVSARIVSRGALVNANCNREGRVVPGTRSPETNEIVDNVVTATLTAGSTVLNALEQAKALVEDFALTTHASALTRRPMWSAPVPTSGVRNGSWARQAPMFDLKSRVQDES